MGPLECTSLSTLGLSPKYKAWMHFNGLALNSDPMDAASALLFMSFNQSVGIFFQ